MGYYSDVRVATTKQGYDMLQDLVQVMLAKEALAGNNVYNLLNHTNVAVYNPEQNYVIFGWDAIKWYEDEPDIQCIIQALRQVSEEQPVSFVRIGEDYSDVETWDTDDSADLPDICPVTYIDIYGRDMDDEIDLKMQAFVKSVAS